MNHAVVAKNPGKTRILVAPLDWGLGHSTRCIPIVRELLGQGADVWLAGEGAQEAVLKEEFPNLPFIFLEGYRVKYASNATGLLLQMLIQSPRLFQSIKKEHKWLKSAVEQHGFDAVISDNRYGLYHPGIPSIIITHQLSIQSPLGSWSEKLIRKQNYRLLDRFNACWVPDTEGSDNLSGLLSHPDIKPKLPIVYIGPLSRFRKLDIAEENNHLLFMLSGPEPQRSILENKLLGAIAHYPGTATFVRGLPAQNSFIPSTGMLQFYNHLSSGELNKEMMRASMIICRSGYSSVMDIAALQKKSILVPTPGQTEQEYLASYLQEKGFAVYFKQKDFNFEIALDQAKRFHYVTPAPPSTTELQKAITGLLERMPAK